MNLVCESNFLWLWALNLDDWGSSNSSSNSLKFPLGHNLNGHDLILFEEMDSGFRHSSRAHNDLDSSLSYSLDNLFESILLGSGIVFKFISLSEQNSSLGLSLLHLNVCVENNNLGVKDVVDGGLGLSDDNHTSNDLGVTKSTSKNLLNSDVVGAEGGLSSWNGMEASLSDQFPKSVLKTVLLGSNYGLHALKYFLVIMDVLKSVASGFLELLHGELVSLLVSNEDFRWMETHLQKTLGLLHQLS